MCACMSPNDSSLSLMQFAAMHHTSSCKTEVQSHMSLACCECSKSFYHIVPAGNMMFVPSSSRSTVSRTHCALYRTHLYGDIYSSPGLEMRQKQLLMCAFLGQANMPDELFGHAVAVSPILSSQCVSPHCSIPHQRNSLITTL